MNTDSERHPVAEQRHPTPDLELLHHHPDSTGHGVQINTLCHGVFHVFSWVTPLSSMARCVLAGSWWAERVIRSRPLVHQGPRA